MDYFLKAATEAELHAALVEAGLLIIENAVVNEAGEVMVPACYLVAGNVVLDIIGPIPRPTGQMVTVDGVEVPEMVDLPGYHANLYGELTDEQRAGLASILLPVALANPYRVLAS